MKDGIFLLPEKSDGLSDMPHSEHDDVTSRYIPRSTYVGISSKYVSSKVEEYPGLARHITLFRALFWSQSDR